MTAFDLAPGNRLPALAARHLDRARVRKFFEVRLDRASEQRRFGLMSAARLASQRSVNLGREFQVHFLCSIHDDDSNLAGLAGLVLGERLGCEILQSSRL
jgi:hypothetical protein